MGLAIKNICQDSATNSMVKSRSVDEAMRGARQKTEGMFDFSSAAKRLA
jgi:hypothetical protein